MKFHILKTLTCTTLFFTSYTQAKEIYFPTRDFRTSDPYISGCTVRSHADFKLDPTSNFAPNQIKAGDIIFVMIDYLETFFSSYHPHIKESYILLTHNFFGESDDPVPDKWSSYLEDEKILAWFAMNPDIIHPKLHPMPIGIASAYYPHGNTTIFDECIKTYKNSLKKELLYINFSTWTNPEYRTPIRSYFEKQGFATCVGTKDTRSYLLDISSHQFVLSPKGHGLDCHRTWETLLMGSFPIVETSPLDPLYQDLPVVIIHDWKEVTPEFLAMKYQELSSPDKTYNLAKLYMPYWIEQMNIIKNKEKNKTQ